MRRPLTGSETLELMALAADAWEAEGEARAAACTAIADFWDGLPFNRARRIVRARDERLDRLARLLAETDPRTLAGRRAA
jgi:hypothetical protein